MGVIVDLNNNNHRNRRLHAKMKEVEDKDTNKDDWSFARLHVSQGPKCGCYEELS